MVGASDKPTSRAFQVVAAAYAAYNAGAIGEWVDAQLAGEFHPDAQSREMSRVDKAQIAEAAIAAGSRIDVIRCFSLGSGTWAGLTHEGVPVAMGHRFCCDTVASNEFHAGSGRDRIEAHRWVIDGGSVVAFVSPRPPAMWSEFTAGFHSWLEVEHPHVAEGFALAPGGTWPSADSVPTALRLVDAYTDASSEWPVTDADRAPAPVVHRLADGMEVSVTDPSQLDLVIWALGRFARAGLDPPQVARVEFESPLASGRAQTCFPGSPAGLASTGRTGGIITLRLPSEALGGATGPPVDTRHLALHEFGHLWNATHLDSTLRDDFLALHGLEVWTGACLQNSTGNEYAAEIVAWGLMDEPIVPNVTQATCDGLARSFELLTGVPADDRYADCRAGMLVHTQTGAVQPRLSD